jgi:hypothetical protein
MAIVQLCYGTPGRGKEKRMIVNNIKVLHVCSGRGLHDMY